MFWQLFVSYQMSQQPKVLPHIIFVEKKLHSFERKNDRDMHHWKDWYCCFLLLMNVSHENLIMPKLITDFDILRLAQEVLDIPLWAGV